MKKLLVLLLTVAMTLSFVACGSNEVSTDVSYKIAMITDYGDITDESFNQTAYESSKIFCDNNGLDFTYYKPAGDSTVDRVAMIDKAVADGYNVIILPGSAFGEAIGQVADIYTDVKFIALDVSEDSLNNYKIGDNVYCAVYQEEIAGFMAGFAAVELGYTHLGFLGGIAFPSVMRYGYGFIQGADWAASIGEGKDVEIEYVYGNQVFGDADITAYMDDWYKNGVECVFACGGGIYTSVAEAAAKVGCKVIGVDVDQAQAIDKYSEGMTVTSAMKGLSLTVQSALEDICLNGNWSEYGGKIAVLGLVSGDEPEKNFVQLAPSTQWDKNGFNEAAYKDLVGQIFDGTITVSNNIEKAPETSVVKVNYQGNIK